MTPLPFHWPYAVPFWAVFFWAFIPEYRIIQKAKRQQTASDAKSIQVITTGGGIAALVAFGIAWRPILLIGPSMQTAAFLVGVAMMIGGGLLRRHCWRMLGESFTGDVRARPDQVIISSGAYRILRHPSYAAGIMMNVGIGLALGSWAATLIFLVSSFGVYAYRIRVEEQALATTIGEPYRQFMLGRKRLVPFIY